MQEFTHKNGQTLKPMVEFVSNESKRLILARTERNVYLSLYQKSTVVEPKYYTKGKWCVLYDNNDGEMKDMGVTFMSYKTRIMTAAEASYHFNRMIDNLKNVNFSKIQRV